MKASKKAQVRLSTCAVLFSQETFRRQSSLVEIGRAHV